MIDFDQRAHEWDLDPEKVERAQAAARALRLAVPIQSSMHAFEYGCGTGLLSFELRDSFEHITLADTSIGMLDVLTKKIQSAGVKNMQPVRLDLAQDPPPSDRFNITYSLMVLHHIPDTRAVLDSFLQILHPDGILCIIDLDKEDGSFHTDPFEGHLGFERPALEGLVRDAGFERMSFTTAHTIRKHGKKYPLFLMVAHRPR